MRTGVLYGPRRIDSILLKNNIFCRLPNARYYEYYWFIHYCKGQLLDEGIISIGSLTLDERNEK